MELNVKIDGAAEMAKVLRQMPREVARRDLGSAMRSGANVVRNAIREEAPVSEFAAGKFRPKTGKNYGKLRDNIRVAGGDTRKGLALIGRRDVAGRLSGSFSGRAIVHTGNAFWGLFLEFGTSKMAPQPFFRRGFGRSAGPALQRIGRTLGRNIERTARELAGRLGAIRKSTRRRL